MKGPACWFLHCLTPGYPKSGWVLIGSTFGTVWAGEPEKSWKANPWRPEVRTALALPVILIPKQTLGFPGAGWFMACSWPPWEGVGVGAGSEVSSWPAPMGMWKFASLGLRTRGACLPHGPWRVRREDVRVQVRCVAQGCPGRCRGRNGVERS